MQYVIIVYYKEAPIYFSNIIISPLGLAYFTPLWCPLKLKFFGCLVGPQSGSLVLVTSPKRFDLGRSLKVGQMRVNQTQENNIPFLNLGLFYIFQQRIKLFLIVPIFNCSKEWFPDVLADRIRRHGPARYEANQWLRYIPSSSRFTDRSHVHVSYHAANVTLHYSRHVGLVAMQGRKSWTSCYAGAAILD